MHIAIIAVGPTNRDPVALADLARRQLDYLGPIGIMLKRGQTDEVFRRDRQFRFEFRCKAMRRRYVQRVRENCPSAVRVELKRAHRTATNNTRQRG